MELNTWRTLGVIFKKILSFQKFLGGKSANGLVHNFLMLHIKYSIHQARIHRQS